MTPGATAGGNRFAGRKPGDTPRRRKRTSEPQSTPSTRCTLEEVLSNIPPDYAQLQYKSQQQNGLKMVFTRVSEDKPPKPTATPSNKPFEFIEIHGNIRKCFGCGLLLKDGPPGNSTHVLDSKYCIRHQEEDFFFVVKYNKWLPKTENKHFHIEKECILKKNDHFDSSAVHVVVNHTLTSTVTTFLAARL